MMDVTEWLNVTEERTSVRKGQVIQYSVTLSDRYYFAGVMVAITAYHTDDGQTVTIPDDELHWYAFGKGIGVKNKTYVERIIPPLKETEARLAAMWTLGVKGMRIDPEVAEAYSQREGLLVLELTPGTPMDSAGLARGDILLAIGDVRILGESSLDRAKASIGEGESVTVLFLRNGEVWQTTLTRPSSTQSI